MREPLMRENPEREKIKDNLSNFRVNLINKITRAII